ncbi:MAG: site-2 protease family protein, partial [Simkaniaceae bacterium]|nr:site-2 protease family protein [Simkaniaceae bacterium]
MKERIPLRISPFFFLVAGIIGWLYSRSLVGTLIWIAIIFISILIHEFGHAITARAFGQSPRIELVAFGGLTYPAGKKIAKWKEFIVVLNGPLFGFALFIIATILLKVFPMNEGTLSYSFVKTLQIVNLFWTIVNLIPILPLDGGQLLRIALEGMFKTRGLKIALLSSMIFAVVLAFYCFSIKFLIAGVLFILFAFQNFQGFRQLRFVTTTDGDDHLKEKLQKAELSFQQGDEKRALTAFEEIINETKEGVIYMIAAGYLA